MAAPLRHGELTSPADVIGQPRSQDRSEYIQAIDGLRALAVVAVVLNHIGFPGMSSGFIGVDIFFAISGFLITRQIMAKRAAGTSLQLREFWAGRARRITPAMVLVIAVTCLGCALFLAPQELERAGFYGLASDLFGMNLVAAARGGNYFDGPLRQSPFLHMWSLGVEEQFYLLWPLLLGPVAVFAARALRWSKQRVLAVGLGAIGAASLLICVVQTSSAPLWAFYGLHARLFEFILGGAAALFWRTKLSHSAERLCLWAGLAALFAAFAWTPVDSGFPGAWPLLPVLGTIALILGFSHSEDTRGSAVTTVFSGPHIRRIGRYSYSWYLWHWPAFVLALAATNENLTVARVACVVSIVPAALSFHFVEQRVRLAPSLLKSPHRSLAMGAAAIGFGAVCAVALVSWGRIGVSDPQIAEWVQAEESFGPAGCEQNTTDFSTEVCLGGSEEPGAPVLLLVGDSHAGQWMSAFSNAGRSRGFAVALRSAGNCPAAPLTTTDAKRSAEHRSCADYQAETLDLMTDGQISATVMTDAGSSRRRFEDIDSWHRGAERLTEAADATDVQVGLLVDNPNFGEPLRCLSRGFSVEDCSTPKVDALADLERYSKAEDHLVEWANISRLDLTAEICPEDPCPIQIDGVWVPARDLHLARAFTELQEGRIGDWAQDLFGKAER